MNINKLFTVTMIVIMVTYFGNALAGDILIPYKIIKNERMGNVKASYDIQVNLVEENSVKRLPNQKELGAISKEIKNKEQNTQRVFVLFYLPGMTPGAGAYAQAHHNPNMEVKIMEFMLYGTKYEKYISK
jgi:hypothetical protein